MRRRCEPTRRYTTSGIELSARSSQPLQNLQTPALLPQNNGPLNSVVLGQETGQRRTGRRPTCMRHICLKHTTPCLKYQPTRCKNTENKPGKHPKTSLRTGNAPNEGEYTQKNTLCFTCVLGSCGWLLWLTFFLFRRMRPMRLLGNGVRPP